MSRYTLRNKSIGYNEPDKKQYERTIPTAFLHGAAMMIRQDIVEKVGLMPEIYFLYYEEMVGAIILLTKVTNYTMSRVVLFITKKASRQAQTAR